MKAYAAASSRTGGPSAASEARSPSTRARPPGTGATACSGPGARAATRCPARSRRRPVSTGIVHDLNGFHGSGYLRAGRSDPGAVARRAARGRDRAAARALPARDRCSSPSTVLGIAAFTLVLQGRSRYLLRSSPSSWCSPGPCTRRCRAFAAVAPTGSVRCPDLRPATPLPVAYGVWMSTVGEGHADLAAWLDVSAGVAGDMLLAALVDAGASLEVAQAAVDAVIPGTVRLVAHETARAGMRALKVDVELLAPDQHHRRWSEIRDLLADADLDGGVRRRAHDAFERLAVAEARVHGASVDDVHFHEVGAWDSIADVVGSLRCAGRPRRRRRSRLAGSRWGPGSVRAAHGTCRCRCRPCSSSAAVGWSPPAERASSRRRPASRLVDRPGHAARSRLPAMTVTSVGIGAGTQSSAERANVVRVVVGRPDAASGDIHPSAAAGGRGGADREAEPMSCSRPTSTTSTPALWPTRHRRAARRRRARRVAHPDPDEAGTPGPHPVRARAPDDRDPLRDLVLDLHEQRSASASHPVTRWALDRGWVDVDVDGRADPRQGCPPRGRIVHVTPEFRDVRLLPPRSATGPRDADAVHAAAPPRKARGAALPANLRATP